MDSQHEECPYVASHLFSPLEAGVFTVAVVLTGPGTLLSGIVGGPSNHLFRVAVVGFECWCWQPWAQKEMISWFNCFTLKQTLHTIGVRLKYRIKINQLSLPKEMLNIRSILVLGSPLVSGHNSHFILGSIAKTICCLVLSFLPLSLFYFERVCSVFATWSQWLIAITCGSSWSV